MLHVFLVKADKFMRVLKQRLTSIAAHSVDKAKQEQGVKRITSCKQKRPVKSTGLFIHL
jgi:hypothetical protein